MPAAELMVSPSAPNKALSDAESLPQSLERLVDLVEKVAVYVDQVAVSAWHGKGSIGCTALQAASHV